MKMTKQDIKQETYINSRWIDAQRSPAWSSSYRNTYIHTNFNEDFLDSKDEIDYVEQPYADYMEYVDQCIDLYDAIDQLSELQKSVILFTINGVNQTTIASIYGCDRSYISRVYTKSIKKLRRILCQS
jgi:DNA-directed RNA polymerase specialized sigma subunit